ncbi:hypothetical protein PF003_g40731 [Phytophthora fragariae]|nr:hypothetical protein PF003_g40731 [Phytophthora fragariae]
MAMPQPIFEVTRAPSLKVWSQSTITTFLRERKQYEGKVIEQCRVTGEDQAAVTRSIRSTLEPRVLEHVAHYILKQDAVSLSDDMLVAEMKRKVDTMLNGRVPEVTQLFGRELMDLSEVDVEARIAAYFVKFDQLVEDNGHASMLGRGVAIDEQGRQRMKLRCKLLLSSVTREMLKIDLTRLVELTHREANVNDLALHDLMIERATGQQQYQLMQAEMKNAAGPCSKETPAAVVKTSQQPAKQQQLSSTPGRSRGAAEQRKPARDGRLICKGAHRTRDCPAATAKQKAEVVRTLRERRDRQPEGVKRITTDDAPAFRTTVINGVLDVPFCPDIGSNTNIIGGPVLEELRDLVNDLPVERVEPPVQVVAAGGSVMICREKVQIELQIVTAAGPLPLANIECLVLDAPEEVLLLGKTTLQSIGVDLDGVFEQHAQQHIDAAEAEADDVPSSHVEVLGTAEDDEVRTVLQAIEAGFDADRGDELRRIVIDHADVFRLRLGH